VISHRRRPLQLSSWCCSEKVHMREGIFSRVRRSARSGSITVYALPGRGWLGEGRRQEPLLARQTGVMFSEMAISDLVPLEMRQMAKQQRDVARNEGILGLSRRSASPTLATQWSSSPKGSPQTACVGGWPHSCSVPPAHGMIQNSTPAVIVRRRMSGVRRKTRAA